jgi:5-carboxymethyl-2-hydroxymuconate isomerase
MPHITLEYSGNLGEVTGLQELFARTHAILAETAAIRMSNCKSRAIPVEACHVGSGHPGSAFVHMDVRILEGRPSATRQAIGRQLLSALRDHFKAPPEVDDLQITVEVRDILKDCYFKFPEGTLTHESPP